MIGMFHGIGARPSTARNERIKILLRRFTDCTMRIQVAHVAIDCQFYLPTISEALSPVDRDFTFGSFRTAIESCRALNTSVSDTTQPCQNY